MKAEKTEGRAVQAIIHQKRWARVLFLGLPLVLAACLTPSDLPPSARAGSGKTPGLVSISSIMARAGDGPHTARLNASPEARIASLRARAAALRGPIISPSQRQRMLSANARLR